VNPEPPERSDRERPAVELGSAEAASGSIDPSTPSRSANELESDPHSEAKRVSERHPLRDLRSIYAAARKLLPLKVSNSVQRYLKENWLSVAGLLFSIAAVVVSIVVLFLTFRNDQLQNIQWLDINSPIFSLRHPKLVTFATVDDPATTDDWLQNYTPMVIPEFDEGRFTGKYQVQTDVVLWDDVIDARASTIKILETKKDLDSELKRLKLTKWSLRKRFIFQFSFLKERALVAENFEMTIKASMPQKPGSKEPLKVVTNFGAPQDKTISLEFLTELDRVLPMAITFQMTMTYEFNGQERELGPVTWTYYTTTGNWLL